MLHIDFFSCCCFHTLRDLCALVWAVSPLSVCLLQCVALILSTKIVGSQDAVAGSWPRQASLHRAAIFVEAPLSTNNCCLFLLQVERPNLTHPPTLTVYYVNVWLNCLSTLYFPTYSYLLYPCILMTTVNWNQWTWVNTQSQFPKENVCSLAGLSLLMVVK